MENKIVKCGKLNISNSSPFTLIAGPCQLENEKHAIDVASELKEITQKLNIGLIYKTSFDKANRTSLKGKRGAGLEKSLPVFDKIRKDIGIPVLTDVHTIEQCEIVSKHIDVLQIPAFLCRQTDLLIAAATNKSVCLHKKAGICKTSTCLETISHCSIVCTSVKTGIPTSFLIFSKTGRDFSRPAPLFPFKLVRLALSKEVL